MKFIPILLSAGLFSISLLSSAQTANNPEISFEKLHHDYGKIQETEGKAEVKFYFTNTGKSSLFISNVQASCGCTATEWTTDSVKPNKTGFVKVVWIRKIVLGNSLKPFQFSAIHQRLSRINHQRKCDCAYQRT
jgi:hypothetical protein